MKIALVTDSTANLTKEEAAENNIKVIPIPIYIDGKEYLEGVDITPEQLFESQRNGAGFPSTSQPKMGDLISTFDQLHAEGYEAIIYICLSSGISGSYSTLMGIKQSNPEYNLYPVDSQITIRLQGYQVLAAAKMIAKGTYTPEEIVAKLAEIRSTIDELFIVDDLNNLSRGGRLSNASAFIGSLLNIKPLLTFNDEAKIVAYDKVRSMKRAVKKIEQEALTKIKALDIPEDKLRILIIQSNDAAQAQEVTDFFKAEVPNAVFETDEFSPVIATYLGEKAIGITWMIDVDQLEF
ncbi:MAG: DegV family protein [Lactobacillus sp.]|jgi:DegV family protein with EDD domain|uniref:DegV family protein n=1 Tax=Lactobacillus porci TaxID=2012477 RepID=A0A6A8MEE1_9LACO|nr:DegV family protein [Lactobacillus porci]MST87146.1 DegV family protein [Lactobacillus porci]